MPKIVSPTSWQMPSELAAQPCPRASELSSAGFWLAVVMSITALIFVGSGITQTTKLRAQHRRYDALVSMGESGSARVTQAWVSRSGKSTTHFVSYTYHVGTQDYEGRDAVSRQNFANRVSGEILPLQYLRDQPTISRLMMGLSPPPYWTCFISFAMPLVFILVFVWPYQKQKKILENGVVTSGRVTSLTKTRNGRSAGFEFTDEGGNVVKGKATLTSKAEVSEGSVVTVMYLSGSKNASLIYPPPLVRLKT